MSLRTVQTMLLLAATLTTGLMAGVFGLYGHTIMRGLGGTDDRTFVAAFQAMDRAIINPVFMLSFFGALLASGAAAGFSLRGEGRPALPWIATAFALYLLTVIITFAVHLPLNDALKAAGDPDRISDLAAVREHFNESRWVAWNVVRTVLSTLAFACLAWALVLHGEAAPRAGQQGSAVLAQR
jgi:uncharacterized membrane protein